ncbi:cobalamin-binding protein [Microbulbifer agarilyticus]|uniref:cobalamin-binding protein n=1 Tax=Microbulbifer agarilyticus TaxID=260552 RepID=UPI001CD4CA0A|nr:cobalamin-binding protein [Microbulbifer agarilyticus]MCA0901106.1 cobalamin-binding protein [Microbulbifer agarilyticus]
MQRTLFKLVITAWILAIASTVSGTELANASIRVQGADGVWLELKQPAERIIALAPSIVENIYSAGAGDKLIAAIGSDYPEAARQLPEIGNHQIINYEALLVLKPDLIIAWSSGTGSRKIEKLRELGFTVFVTETKSLQDIAGNVRTFGEIAGTSSVANRAANDWTRRLQNLMRGSKDKQNVSVLYQVWHKPLQTLNGDHLISDIIEACGGRNAYADAAVLAPQISVESVLDRDPEVIIASGLGETRPQSLDDWRRYPGLTAVKNNNLYHVPPDIIQRHTMRVLDGMQLVCDQLDQARDRTM